MGGAEPLAVAGREVLVLMDDNRLWPSVTSVTGGVTTVLSGTAVAVSVVSGVVLVLVRSESRLLVSEDLDEVDMMRYSMPPVQPREIVPLAMEASDGVAEGAGLVMVGDGGGRGKKVDLPMARAFRSVYTLNVECLLR